ncbi:MAG: hypothetical protein JXX29_07970 [Deltaproteobacteria bacterium]|nr:hypothetical protein [Deltaproteobacteria bacterium]MBN2671595.1 hypothetical protein [Deltaproteobacteria bacterium]
MRVSRLIVFLLFVEWIAVWCPGIAEADEAAPDLETTTETGKETQPEVSEKTQPETSDETQREEIVPETTEHPEPVTGDITQTTETDSQRATANEASPSADHENGVRVSSFVSSIYNFRGMNVFKETSQSDQNAVYSPAVTWTVLHPGLWFKYASFFQINGDNRAYLVDSGVGAEQDLATGFDYTFFNKLTLSASFTYYCYPFSRSRITGVHWPSYLEPAVGIGYRTHSGIRFGLNISYFAPVQGRLRDNRYMYSHFEFGKAYQFHPKVAVDFDLGMGYKLFADPSILQDTIFDFEFGLSVPYTIVKEMKLVPAVHTAWTYLVSTSFGDQYMIYFSVDLVIDF